MGRSAKMSRKAFERAVALSRTGDVAGALDVMAPGGARAKGTSETRRHAGHQAQVRGAAIQQQIRESLRAESDAGRCVWAEGNPRVRGTPGAMFPVEPATVDFTILAQAIGIAFDLKSIHQMEHYSIAGHTGDLKTQERDRRQVEWLLQFRRQGGIAFLLLYEAKLNRAWLCFALQTLLEGEGVKVRSLDRAQRGIPARVVDHLPAIEPSPLALGARWRILDAALAHGRKTMATPVEIAARATGERLMELVG